MKNIVILLLLLIQVSALAGKYDSYIERLNLDVAQIEEIKPILMNSLKEKDEAIVKIRETKGFFKKIPIMKELASKDEKLSKDLEGKLRKEQLREWELIQEEVKKKAKAGK